MSRDTLDSIAWEERVSRTALGNSHYPNALETFTIAVGLVCDRRAIDALIRWMGGQNRINGSLRRFVLRLAGDESQAESFGSEMEMWAHSVCNSNSSVESTPMSFSYHWYRSRRIKEYCLTWTVML